jgi:UDPglucose--hexose-1-phosphate uridylyltransferase
MSELRQDPTTYDWIIMATERSVRPHELNGRKSPKHRASEYDKECPFCPGNEQRTPPAETVYGDNNNWEIRVVQNKFPALTPEGNTNRIEYKLFRKTQGYGRHEVVIESPRHNEFLPFMENEHIEHLLQVFRDRYHALKKDSEVKIIIIFKNHGEGAGTSLEHPHTQIIASPVVPPFIRRRLEIATQHYDNTGTCLYHELLLNEREVAERIIMETEHFVSLHPFASHYPFETWIMPKVHKSSFGDITEDEIRDLSVILKSNLIKLYEGLDDPDYNLIIHTSPVDDEHKLYYLWHIQIVPRLTQMAGFELGSGIYINIALPEQTASFLKES